MRRAAWWIRRDLRVVDNAALSHAIDIADEVFPVFVIDPLLTTSKYVGEKRRTFLLKNLSRLDSSLRERGSHIFVLMGSPIEALSRFVNENQIDTIIAQPDYSPYASQRDIEIEKRIPIQWIGSPAFRPPGVVLNRSNKPFRVFTPFSKAWKSLPGLTPSRSRSAPNHISTPTKIQTNPILQNPAYMYEDNFPTGEAAAQKRLQEFILGQSGDPSNSPIYRYGENRTRPDLDGTSQLSPYLRFGLLSINQVVSQALLAIQDAPNESARTSAETWLNEIIWRDFFMHILHHYPRVLRENFRLPHIRWENNRTHFGAWCEGLTGYPIVDAAMRQLVTTGWMHNRCRMITASFLTKDLLIDWRWGEEFFMQHLIDGDPAANNGGWQWTAGTGTDAAPYFRILNPVAQSTKHDPESTYIRKYLPELTHVPAEFIHEPWNMPEDVQKRSACIIGRDYPEPIVDHAGARKRTLKAYNPKTP